MRKLLESDRILFGVLIAVLLVGLAVRNRDALADTATSLVQSATEKLRGMKENTDNDRAPAAVRGIHGNIVDRHGCRRGCRGLHRTCR